MIIVALDLKEWKNSTIHVYKRIDKYVLYRMVGNFREVLIFTFFTSQKPIARKKFLLTKLTRGPQIHQPRKFKISETLFHKNLYLQKLPTIRYLVLKIYMYDLIWVEENVFNVWLCWPKGLLNFNGRASVNTGSSSAEVHFSSFLNNVLLLRLTI